LQREPEGEIVFRKLTSSGVPSYYRADS
jgi:hypothetical protein